MLAVNSLGMKYRTIWISDLHLGTRGSNTLVEHLDGTMQLLHWKLTEPVPLDVSDQSALLLTA